MSTPKKLRLRRTLPPLFAMLASASTALGWGHSKDFSEKPGWAPARLVFAVRAKHEINYCVELQDSRYDQKSVALEVESALRLWLSATADAEIASTRITRSDCSLGQFDLKISIGPETRYTTLSAYQVPTQDATGHLYTMLKINTTYVYLVDGRQYRPIPFASLVPRGQTLEDVLKRVTTQRRETVKDFAEEIGVDWYNVYFSSYKTFVHELGHSFGLCDTYASQIRSCDSSFMSPDQAGDQPDSVMKTAMYFYLTPDDVSGIVALFQRFR